METYKDLILVHSGVKGMKWGVRKQKNFKETPRNAKKIDKKIYKSFKKNKFDKVKNSKRVIDKMNSEWKNSNEYKKYEKLAKRDREISKKEGSTSIGLDTISAYNKLSSKSQEIAKKYRSQYAEANLKDLNYKVTKSGRDYLEKYMSKNK